MVFPTSNLPTSAVPWGREVEKQINTVAATVKSNEVNNTARDNQLAASLIRLQAAQAKADAAFAATDIIGAQADALETDVTTLQSNVYFPGTTTINGGNIRTGTVGATQISSSYVYAGSISAGQISAGSVYGLSISGGSLSTTGSTYIDISGTSITFNYNGSSVGSLYGSYNSSSGKNGIIATTNLFAVMGELGVYNSLLNLSNSSLYSANFGGTLITAGGTFRGTGFTGTSYIQSENYAGGGTTGASINNNGTIIRTGSSQRYKQDILNVDYSYEDILTLQPKTFRWINEVEEDENARVYPGFIAEEISGGPLDVFVAYQTLPDGSKRPDGVFYAELTSALVSAIKHQDSLIKDLTTRLDLLENN